MSGSSTAVKAAARRIFVHGLTGGVATGKTHACSVLQKAGAHVLHADTLAHECYAPRTEANHSLRQAFGPAYFLPDGTVNRAKLGKLVFEDDPRQLQVLNAIMFPATEARAKQAIAQLTRQGHKWVVIEAALLLEAGWQAWMDEVWAMVVDKDVARKRLMERNGLTAGEADRRIAAQRSNEAKIQAAAAAGLVTINASGSKQATAAKITAEVAKLRKRVQAQHGFDLV